MAILHAYYDDSADDKRERFMAVAGLIGSDAQFTALESLWSSATRNPPEPFRSTDCETRHDQFSGWDKKDCDDLMEQLVGIIHQTGLGGFASIVPVRDYRSVFPDAKEYDPYFLALRHVLINMAYVGAVNCGDNLGTVEIRIRCEDSTTTSNRAKNIYDELRDFDGWRWGKAFAGFSTATKKLMALQAADLIAREAYKHAANLGIRPTRKPVKVLHKLLSFHLWTRPSLEYLRDSGGQSSLKALTGWGQSAIKPPHMRRFYGTTFDLT